MEGSPVDEIESDRRLAVVATWAPGQLLAVAAVLAALLFGLAGVIGAIGYLVAVSRSR